MVEEGRDENAYVPMESMPSLAKAGRRYLTLTSWRPLRKRDMA
jgi:hypothetical protein